MAGMKVFPALAAIFFGATLFSQAVEYKIEHVSRGKEYAWVDDQWDEGAECVELKVSANEKQGANDVYYRAYFYDKADKLIYSAKKPSTIWEYGESNVYTPKALEAGKKYSVYFAVPKVYTTGDKKWRRVIVVFGNQEQAVAQLFPKGEIKPYDFPEKSRVK